MKALCHWLMVLASVLCGSLSGAESITGPAQLQPQHPAPELSRSSTVCSWDNGDHANARPRMTPVLEACEIEESDDFSHSKPACTTTGVVSSLGQVSWVAAPVLPDGWLHRPALSPGGRPHGIRTTLLLI